MPFTDRKFGVEIEFTGVSRNTVRQALNDAGFPCDRHGRAQTTNMWCVVYDGSVTGAAGHSENENSGGELVSPILSGEDGLEKISKVARIISRLGGKADRTCGLHVHVDANDIQIPELKIVAHRYARFENEIDQFMPRSRRANSNNFCYSMSHGNVLGYIDNANVNYHFDTISRYYKVNLNSYYRHGTIEFRQHSGSINPEKIRNWIRFCVSFVEESRNVYNAMNAAAEALRAERQAQIQQQIDSIPIPQAPVLRENTNPVPENFPLRRVEYTDNLIKIVNREALQDNHFRYLYYDECQNLSSTTIRYVLRALIRGFDIEQDRVYTYAVGTVRRAMSALRSAGFNIYHRRGTNRYILAVEQPKSIFSNNVINTLFNGAEMQYQQEFSQYQDNLRQRERRIQELQAVLGPRYDNNIDDALFRGMDEELVSFYQERAHDFEEQLANGRR